MALRDDLKLAVNLGIGLGVFLAIAAGVSRFVQPRSGLSVPCGRISHDDKGFRMTFQSGDQVWPRVSVVIPTLNEARNLPHVFARMPPNLHEVIVVDGHSVDDTLAVARAMCPDVRIVMQTRKGKGNALACGFAAATGDIIAMVDADGSADPGEIPRFVRALLDGADFAKGTRFAKGGGSDDITRIRRLGNRFLCAVVNVLYGTKYTDLCYGYNVFWRRHLGVLGLDATSRPASCDDGMLWGDGFEVETLVNIRVPNAGLKVTEVPSFEHSRIHGVSNLNAVSDGMRVLRTVLTERRQSSQQAAQAEESAGIAWTAGDQAMIEPWLRQPAAGTEFILDGLTLDKSEHPDLAQAG